MKIHTEEAFEAVIESHLLANGYTSLSKDKYNTEMGLFPQSALTFIKTTQEKEYGRIETLLKEKTDQTILKDLCYWLNSQGALPVLRNGFKSYGRNLRIAFFRPAHGMNPELEAQYQANELGVTRQLRYSAKNNNELDLVLSINGLPVITSELKNPLTGQTVSHAMKQYCNDRDHRELLFDFKKRALVHFAVDTELVFMTTRLAGSATRFLPFNQGDNNGSGNPSDPKGEKYPSAYLWEEVWQRDSLFDIFTRFIHLQVEEKITDEGRNIKKETMIFPRYHQLSAVRQLIKSASVDGPGNNYLIEHSAGSGKSNTIGWLAHRLASLHNESDQKVFDSIIVITDRRVLDKQLQDTIFQFDHRQGVVQKIDKNSKQLAQALQNSIPIIISTLQKFPFVTRQLVKMAEEQGAESEGILPSQKFAVIIDEAHSSQSGESAADLKEVLGGMELRESAAKYAAEEGTEDLEELYRSMAKRGKQANMSFFAFTATPKHKTLKVFGQDRDGASGKPFHKYTMRQAIEEGFIMDVLKNYTTYATYYKLLKAGEADPNVERKNAAKALARFMRLHPYNISQKTEVIIEHFNTVTRFKMGGRAKAMVLTGSRLEAVRYKLAFDKYIKEKKYTWIKTLVAFSGEVRDEKISDKKFTEVSMNKGIKESELPEKFASLEYQVLLVAEKYQTGFDQPLLHTMFVDKRLAGIQAVQTLSRLNRMHPLKEDTFILDFVNDREEIREAFKTYYEGSELGEEADPNHMYSLKVELDQSGLYTMVDVERFTQVFFKPKKKQSAADHQTINAIISTIAVRFARMQDDQEEEAELLRSKLNSFRNLYAFLSQIIPYQDSDLERFYTFVRHLLPKLPKRTIGKRYDFDDDIRLEYYRLQKISEGSISLSSGQASPLDGPTDVGTGKANGEEVPLSKLVDIINERFGTDFNEADQLFFDQIIEAAMEEDSLQEAVEVNSQDKFSLFFDSMLQTLFIERMEQNEEIFARYMNETDFKGLVSQWISERVYTKIRESLSA